MNASSMKDEMRDRDDVNHGCQISLRILISTCSMLETCSAPTGCQFMKTRYHFLVDGKAQALLPILQELVAAKDSSGEVAVVFVILSGDATWDRSQAFDLRDENDCMTYEVLRDLQVDTTCVRLLVMHLKAEAWELHNGNSLLVPEIRVFRRQIYGVLREHWVDHGAHHMVFLGKVSEGHSACDKGRIIAAVDLLTRGLTVAASRSTAEEQPAFLEARLEHGSGVEGASATRLSLDSVLFALAWDPPADVRTYISRLSRACTVVDTPASALLSASRPVKAVAAPHQVADSCIVSGVKPLPTEPREGLRVLEFFSGIGGMRLALPKEARGLPVRHVTAFDVSIHCNQVYSLNFCEGTGVSDAPEPHGNSDSFDGALRCALIDGLRLDDVDGMADMWTMSPPCQPYTTTRHATRLDARDNRSRGLFHLMALLKVMRHRPRWLVLENVQGFCGSDVLEEWKATLRKCGYRWRQYLLSPIDSAGLPNHRMRYYMTAEYHFDPTHPTTITEVECDTINRSFPPSIRARYSSFPPPIAHFIRHDLSPETLQELYLPLELLQKPWASERISIVGSHDRHSACFTKTYGKLVDKSVGSCFLEGATGPTVIADRSELRLVEWHGRLRRFDPDEVLAISGFPLGFRWPDGMPLKQRWACVGNSINVAVVQGVMACLFEEVMHDLESGEPQSADG